MHPERYLEHSQTSVTDFYLCITFFDLILKHFSLNCVWLLQFFLKAFWRNVKNNSSHWKCSIKKVFFNFTKFTEKYICRNLFFVKVVGLRPVNLLKRDSQRGFFCKFCKILEHLFNRTRLGAVSENPKEYWHWKKCRSLKNVNQVVFNELFPCSNKIKFEQKKLKEDA